MSDYIKREDAISAVKHAWAKGLEPSQYLEIIPAADVVEVKHGEWIKDEGGIVICSNCGEEHCWDEYRAPYCDQCGAKMDLED